MTTPTRTTSNKTALRASLKKEDDSLADRLVGADAPLVAATETADLDPPASAAPRARRTAARPPAKPASSAATAPARAATRKAAAAKPAPTPAAAGKARAASTKAVATTARPKARAAKEEGPVEMIEKVAKQKRDKLVSYSLKLLKSEEAAIDALRDELSKAAGWAATKSDILRAGVQVFAKQKLEQMQALLGTLVTPEKGKRGKKRGSKSKKK